MNEIQEFIIAEQLPSLNEYIAKCRANPYMGAKFKSDVEQTIGVFINSVKQQGGLRPLKTEEFPCTLEIEWVEHTAKRDVDNIKSAAKFILDALVKNDILPDDNQRFVEQIHDTVKVDKKHKSYVKVKIIPKGAENAEN